MTQLWFRLLFRLDCIFIFFDIKLKKFGGGYMGSFIKGNYKKSLFQGDNGYIVGLFKIKEADDENSDLVGETIPFTGYFHELNDNDTYILYGKFVIHAKYGEQFVVESYERCMPEEKDAIVEFLASGLFKGIGEAKAKKIVDFLGKDTLNVILDNPDKLLLIPGITKKNIEVLTSTLEEYQASYKIVLALNDLGFVTKDSMIIYNKYKNRTLEVIDNNIYKLYEDIKEIPFKKIDSIALKSDYAIDDERRLKASILYVVLEVCNTYGHSYLFIDEIYGYVNRCLMTTILKDAYVNALNSLILDLKIVKENEKYFLKEMYEDEVLIVNRIKYLMGMKDDSFKKIDLVINELEEYQGIKYNDDQLLAIKNSLIKHFLVITGGPGTGKTTIVKAIVDLYKELNDVGYDKLGEKIALLAPTGRASKRLSEATHLPAYTIHRFLKWNKETDRFQVNEYNKSDVEFVIIDEGSMVDVGLFASLLRGLRSDTKIIIVGDYNQLPSVGPGQVLKDLIESEKINLIKLNYLYRQSSDSNIINLAYDINSGIVNNDSFNRGSDLILKDALSVDVMEQIKMICNSYKKMDYKDFQILVPMYKTLNGIDNINKVAQEIFNPKSHLKKEIKVGDVIYREDDKVLQLANMPEENIFNGDIGIIDSVDKKEIVINFDDNYVRFTPANFNKFKHGYAISIHKAQGSEFKTVVIPVVKEYNKMLYRKLYYTGVTRAKKELYIVGDINYLRQAAFNNNSDIRRTTIKDKLILVMEKKD